MEKKSEKANWKGLKRKRRNAVTFLIKVLSRNKEVT
jgi:hypothetical protein